MSAEKAKREAHRLMQVIVNTSLSHPITTKNWLLGWYTIDSKFTMVCSL